MPAAELAGADQSDPHSTSAPARDEHHGEPARHGPRFSQAWLVPRAPHIARCEAHLAIVEQQVDLAPRAPRCSRGCACGGSPVGAADGRARRPPRCRSRAAALRCRAAPRPIRRKLGDAEDAAALGRRHADFARGTVGIARYAGRRLVGDPKQRGGVSGLRCLTFGAALSISTVERPSARWPVTMRRTAVPRLFLPDRRQRFDLRQQRSCLGQRQPRALQRRHRPGVGISTQSGRSHGSARAGPQGPATFARHQPFLARVAGSRPCLPAFLVARRRTGHSASSWSPGLRVGSPRGRNGSRPQHRRVVPRRELEDAVRLCDRADLYPGHGLHVRCQPIAVGEVAQPAQLSARRECSGSAPCTRRSLARSARRWRASARNPRPRLPHRGETPRRLALSFRCRRGAFRSPARRPCAGAAARRPGSGVVRRSRSPPAPRATPGPAARAPAR